MKLQYQLWDRNVIDMTATANTPPPQKKKKKKKKSQIILIVLEMELEKNNEIKIKLEKWELPVSHGDNMLNTEHSVQYFD